MPIETLGAFLASTRDIRQQETENCAKLSKTTTDCYQLKLQKDAESKMSFYFLHKDNEINENGGKELTRQQKRRK